MFEIYLKAFMCKAFMCCAVIYVPMRLIAQGLWSTANQIPVWYAAAGLINFVVGAIAAIGAIITF